MFHVNLQGCKPSSPCFREVYYILKPREVEWQPLGGDAECFFFGWQNFWMVFLKVMYPYPGNARDEIKWWFGKCIYIYITP